MKNECGSSADEEDRPLKSRFKKVVAPPKVDPPKKKRAKRGEGPRKRAKKYVKIVNYECKDCDKKFSGPTEFYDHARVKNLSSKCMS